MAAFAKLPTATCPRLLSPVSLGALQLRNRVVMSPLTRGRATNRVPNARMVEYYKQQAEHTGMIIAEATTINAKNSNGWIESPGIYTAEQAEGWQKVTDAVRGQDCRFALQLWHMGRAARSSFGTGHPIVAPSATQINGANFGSADGMRDTSGAKVPFETPKALSADEIDELVDDYLNAARLAHAAGFDAVEVHSANGYLLDTFLQSTTNRRDDQYGGTCENRMRMLNRVLDAVATVYPPDRIGVRLSPNGVYNDMGSADSVATFTYALRNLARRGLAWVDVMDGLAFGFHDKCEPLTIADCRKAYGAGTIMCNCGYDRDSGEAVLAAGDAHAVCIGRPFIANPDLVYRCAHDLPIAEGDPATWFTHDDEGYHTYPKYEIES